LKLEVEENILTQLQRDTSVTGRKSFLADPPTERAERCKLVVAQARENEAKAATGAAAEGDDIASTVSNC